MSDNPNRDLAILAEKEILQKVTEAMRSKAGPKRWFWELLQNAIDTIAEEDDRKIDVTVILESNEQGALMHFIHNGGPFKETKDINRFDDFKNLILPRSNKKTSDKKTVGKFGTGFLSTHNLSLKIDVSGVFQTNDGSTYKVETTLDRTHFIDEDDKYDSNRIESITKGLDKFKKSQQFQLSVDSEITRFIYHLNDNPSINKVRTGFKDIEYSLPMVFSLNSKVKRVTIDNRIDNEYYQYLFGETDPKGNIIFQQTIREENGVTSKSSVVQMGGEKITLCWPVCFDAHNKLAFKNSRANYKEEVKDKMPLIYCTFPMIGSGELHFPIVVHSAHFKPNNARDGISLTDETYTDENTQAEIELDVVNKELIKDAVKLYKEFINTVAVKAKYPYYITKLNKFPDKDWVDTKWYKDTVLEPLRKTVTEACLIDVYGKEERSAIVDTEGNIQVFFPRVETNDKTNRKHRLNQKLYTFAVHLFKDSIPSWEDLQGWHDSLWVDKDRIRVLDIKDIAKKVEEFKSVNGLAKTLSLSPSKTYKWLNHLYAFIDEVEEDHLYKELSIVPNQKGIFKKSEDNLYLEDSNSKIEPELICILRSFNSESDWFDKLVHRSVKCKHHFEKKSLKEDVGLEINKELNKKDDVGYYILLKNEKLAKRLLRRLLSLKSGNEQKESNLSKVKTHFATLFGPLKERTISNFGDFDNSNVAKHSIRLINQIIEKSKNLEGLAKVLKKDQDNTVIWLDKFLNLQINSSEFEGLIHWANVIPNQYQIFKAHGKDGETDRMYKPYILNNNNVDQKLESGIIKVLKDLSSDVSDDWKNILVLDGVQLKTLPSKTWHNLGHDVDLHVHKILSTIVEDKFEQKAKYYKPMLSLLEWCEDPKNKNIAAEHFKTTYDNKDKLYLQLTYSPENVAILKDQQMLDIAKKIKNSGISTVKMNETIDVIESLYEKFGEKSIDEFLSKAEDFISHKERFNNRLETGQNIEELLRQALASFGIGVDSKKSYAGAYDIEVTNKTNPGKNLKLEVKSYKYGTSHDFRFATSQIIEANRDSSNYIVCTLERKPNDEVCDIKYLQENLKVQSSFGKITSDVINVVKIFSAIYEGSKRNQNPLEIPCIDEPRVKIEKNTILQGTGGFVDLVEIIKKKLL